MSDVGEAVEGIVAFIVGGFMLLLISSTIESSSVLYDLGTFGLLMILLGIVLAIAVVAMLVGKLSGW